MNNKILVAIPATKKSEALMCNLTDYLSVEDLHDVKTMRDLQYKLVLNKSTYFPIPIRYHLIDSDTPVKIIRNRKTIPITFIFDDVIRVYILQGGDD